MSRRSIHQQLSRSLEEVFIRAEFRTKSLGGPLFPNAKEIRAIVAYLRVLTHPGEAVSMRRILTRPRPRDGIVPKACVAVDAVEHRRQASVVFFRRCLHEAAHRRQCAVLNTSTRADRRLRGFVRAA